MIHGYLMGIVPLFEWTRVRGRLCTGYFLIEGHVLLG